MSLRIIFGGTPETARPSLKALFASGHEVAAVITQPDRPAGRGRKLTPPPVKVEASTLGLEVHQFASAKDPKLLKLLEGLRPDVLAVAALGLILPRAVLDACRVMPVNLHFSLLPALRGAAPVNWALIQGFQETGVTTIKMVEGLDEGPILGQRATPIGPHETVGELAARLAQMGAGLLVETLNDLAAGRLEPRPQDQAQASYAPPLRPADGRLDLSQPARMVQARGRGVTPWPGASLGYGPIRLKVYDLDFDQAAPQGEAGVIVDLGPLGFKVACGSGHLFIGRIQHPGRRAIKAAEAVRGAGPRPGERLQ